MYESCGPALLNYLLGMTRGDRYRAEDILQQTLMRAWRHPEARGPDGRWSRTWLFAVARNIAIDHLRAQQLRLVELGDHAILDRPSTEDSYERMLGSAEVRAALEALPSRLRDVLVELYLGEQSVNEVAARLGIPAGTVKSRTFYAMGALREELRARRFELSRRANQDL
jgi:RNA polymerase sigma-70 factor (ECF subfamily)